MDVQSKNSNFFNLQEGITKKIENIKINYQKLIDPAGRWWTYEGNRRKSQKS